MRIVVFELDVFGPKIKDAFPVLVQFQFGQRPRLASQLQSGLFQMIDVQMGVTQCVNELPRLQIGDLGNHGCQQGVGGNVEGDAEKRIGTALIELAGQAAIGDMKLKQGVTGGELHLGDFCDVPRADHHSPRVRLRSNQIDDLRDLIDCFAIAGFPRPPLTSVDRAQLAVLVGPFVPDRNTVLLQIPDIGVATEKPQQLVYDRGEMQFLGCDRGNPSAKSNRI